MRLKTKKGKENTNVDALSRIKVNINEIDTDIENFDVSTVHSADEDHYDRIYISERPLNEFSKQLILKQSKACNSKPKIKILFKNKQRITIKRNFTNIRSLTDIIADYINRKRVTAVLPDDKTFRLFQAAYSKYFSNKGLKVVRCMSILKDVTEQDLQENVIPNYHSKSNHRGISEFYLLYISKETTILLK